MSENKTAEPRTLKEIQQDYVNLCAVYGSKSVAILNLAKEKEKIIDQINALAVEHDASESYWKDKNEESKS